MAQQILAVEQKRKFNDGLPKVNPYNSRLPRSLVRHDAAETVKVMPSSGVYGSDTTVTYQLPLGGHICELYLGSTLPAPTGGTGTYVNYPGLQLIKTLTIEHNGTQVYQIPEYPKFLAAMLSGEMDHERRGQVFQYAGGTSGGSWVVTPIFTPWSTFWNSPQGEPVAPLPVDTLRGNVIINLEMNLPSSLLIGPGTAGTLTGQLYVERTVHRDTAHHDWFVKSIIPKMGPSLPFTGGVSKRVTISHISGELRSLCIYNHANSHGIDVFDGLTIPNSTQFWLNANQLSDPVPTGVAIQQMIHKRNFQRSTINNFGDLYTWSPSQWTGTLRSAIGSMTLTGDTNFEVELTVNADGIVNLIGINHCWIRIENGLLKKVE